MRLLSALLLVMASAGLALAAGCSGPDQDPGLKPWSDDDTWGGQVDKSLFSAHKRTNLALLLTVHVLYRVPYALSEKKKFYATYFFLKK